MATLLVLALVVTSALYVFGNEKDNEDSDLDIALGILDRDEGLYSENTIILQNTNAVRAETIAKDIGADLRISRDGKFAQLTVPIGMSIRDIYIEHPEYVKDFGIDYYSYIAEESNGRLLEPSMPDSYVTDTYYDRQTYLGYLTLGNAWAYPRNNDITVAIIDTGIDTDHPEFAGRISEYSYNASTDKIVKDNDMSVIEDEQGHGTTVAGVLAASMDGQGIVGIAPNVNLLIIKCKCDEDGRFLNTSDLVFGLYYAIERGANVINMSFGTSTNVFSDATLLAVDNDIICVAAAGNDSTASLTYPAADKNVIGVGALADSSWELATYSNYGENVDVVAPGSVFTTKIGGTYGTTQGTSLASPLVAGAVALMMSTSWNTYEYSYVYETLAASCYDLGSPGKDRIFGFGAVDVGTFVNGTKKTVTFDMLTDELDDEKHIFYPGIPLQQLPEPERNYFAFGGWYYDPECTEELMWYSDFFVDDLTLYASWINEDEGLPFTYVVLSDDTVEIRSYTGHRKYIAVPEMIEDRVVTSIGDDAFRDRSDLRLVSLPSGLKKIGVNSFYGCMNLISIDIPSGVVSIGEKAFYDCILNLRFV